MTDPLATLLAERACERLLIEFVRRLDLGDPADVADLFTPDGVWEWPAGARATSYLVTYRVDGYPGEMVPPPAPANVGHYEDTLENHDGRWLLSRRSLVLPFGGPTPRV